MCVHAKIPDNCPIVVPNTDQECKMLYLVYTSIESDPLSFGMYKGKMC